MAVNDSVCVVVEDEIVNKGTCAGVSEAMQWSICAVVLILAFRINKKAKTVTTITAPLDQQYCFIIYKPILFM